MKHKTIWGCEWGVVWLACALNPYSDLSALRPHPATSVHVLAARTVKGGMQAERSTLCPLELTPSILEVCSISEGRDPATGAGRG